MGGISMKTLSFLRRFEFALALGVPACGAAAGTKPHDLSVAEHRAAAARESTEGSGHAAQYDASAERPRKRCLTPLSTPPGSPPYTPSGGTAAAGYAPAAQYPTNPICWMENVNPTAEHDEVAREHHRLAAQHRSASQALQAAEARACAGIAEDDRDISPFAHRGDIRSVSPLAEEVVSYGGTKKTGRIIGAT